MNSSSSIRILLVDDHDLVRRGLSVFLATQDDFELVGEAADGVEAETLCQELQPDVVLMDLVMPRQGGLETIRKLNSQESPPQIIALTSHAEDHQVNEALQAGAIGFLHKNVSVEELATAIRAAKEGQPTLSAQATKAVIRTASAPRPSISKLTPREQEVLALLVDGLNNTKIAEKLVIGRATVKTHVSNILHKLEVENRQEAISKAIRQNLL